MNNDQQVRQQISDLADGEIAPSQLQPLLEQLRKPELKADWDLYHRIGDTLRSEQMAAELSPGFSQRFAERLAAEPSLLAPKRHSAGSLRGWGVALTAVAAAATGFVLSPTLFHEGEISAPASLARGSETAAPVVTPVSTLLADASGAITQDDEHADYILLHTSANPSLYGAPALARPAALSSRTEK